MSSRDLLIRDKEFEIEMISDRMKKLGRSPERNSLEISYLRQDMAEAVTELKELNKAKGQTMFGGIMNTGTKLNKKP